MASNYPGSLDSFDTIASDKKTSDSVGGRTHRDMHNDLGDAIEAVQGELGTDPSGASATVKARFDVIEANDWVTSARIAADAVGSSEIAANAVGASELADNAVDTAAIADGAVTAAKILIGAATVGSGTGTPEGVITAAPGSTWLQIGDAVTVSGNLLWRKISGTGNTGWEPEGALADTGWRTVTLENGWTGTVLVRRVGSVIDVRGHALAAASATTGVVYTLPAGMRPGEGSASVRGVWYKTDLTLRRIAIATDGTITISAYAAGDTLYGSECFTNLDATPWPTSLPGAAV